MWGKRSETAIGTTAPPFDGCEEINLARAADFAVGRVQVQPSRRQLVLDGEYRILEPRVMQVLVALAQHHGDVVSRDQLAETCWGGRIVGEDALNRCIAKIRQLGSESGAFAIETIPRVGYRLNQQGEVRATAGSSIAVRHWKIAALLLLLLAAAALLLLRRGDGRPAGPSAAVTSVALLPFSAASSDPQAVRLASATHDALVNALLQSQYEVSAIDHVSEGQRPPADFIISGHLDSTSGGFVATIRMEETEDHILVFAHQFQEPRDKADDLPDLVGGEVASQLGYTARSLMVERQHPSDPAILASLFESSSAGLYGSGAVHDYQRAAPLAAKYPDSALAQMDLAYDAAFALTEIPQDQRGEALAAGRKAADRAVALAPEFGDSYAPWCLLHSEQFMAQCERRLRFAMTTDPDSSFAGWFLASRILNRTGREAEALELARVSLAHDPYMPAKIGLLLQLLEATGQSGEADGLYRQSGRWWPNDGWIDWARMAGIAESGDFKRLAKFAAQISNPNGPDPVFVAVGAENLPQIRNKCQSAQDLEGVVCMMALARLGDLDSAFAIGNRLYPSRHGRMPIRPTASGCKIRIRTTRRFLHPPVRRRCDGTLDFSFSRTGLACSPIGGAADCPTSVRKRMNLNVQQLDT